MIDETTATKNLVSLTVPVPAGDEESKALTAEQWATEFTIENAQDSIKAQEARSRLNTKAKTLTEARLAQTRPIDAAKATIMAWWNKPIQAYERARVILDKKILAYDAEQERIRREAQAKLDAQAAAERKKIEDAAAETARKAQEQADAKRKAAAEAEAAGNTTEAAKLAAAAARIEEKADAKVENLQQRAASVVTATVVSESTKAAGSSFREVPEFEILDATKINPAFMTPDLVKIGKLVKSLGKDAGPLIGEGIKIEMKKALATRKAF